MAKFLKNPSVYFFLIVAMFLVLTPQAYAGEFVFTDNFSSDHNIDKNQSHYVLANGTLFVPIDSASSRIVSGPVIRTSYNIGSAKLDVSQSIPSGSRIIYFLSNDDGDSWINVEPGYFINFSNFGRVLRWSAIITKQDANSQSPSVFSVTIIARESDMALATRNDSRRISDLSTVANAISVFYKDYGLYPHVTGTDAKSRWNELMSLLSRNSGGGRSPRPYLNSAVYDPLRTSNEMSYDYKDPSSNEYILAATLEISNNSVLFNDFDGIIGGINCDDAVYCRGVLRNYSYTQTSSGGSVLGASTFESTTTTSTSTSTRNFGNPVGLNLNALISNPVNSLLGRQILDFGDYYASSPITTVNSSDSSSTNSSSTNSQNTRQQAETADSGSGNSGQVAGVSVSDAAEVATGTTDTLILSLFFSLVIAFVYMYYTGTDLFKKLEAKTLIKKHRLDKDKFNFAINRGYKS